jgi:hypothetical protein
MASDNWAIADILTTQDQKETTANAQTNQIDKAVNNPADKTISGASNAFTAAEWEQTGVIHLVGTPTVDFNLDALNATTNMVKTITNDTGRTCTLRNSAGGGITIDLFPGAAGIFSYDGTDWVKVAEMPVGNNLLINGEPQVWQRGTSFTLATTPTNADDQYHADRWLTLSEAADTVDISQETTIVPDGGSSAFKYLVATANNKWAGVQILTAERSKQVINQRGSFSLKLRTTTGAAIRNVRAAIISWTSTADAVTSDVITTWAGEGTNPTLATNWVFENTAVDFAVPVDAYGIHRIENVLVDAGSAANVAVLFWVDDKDAAANDELYVSDLQFEVSPKANQFQRKSFEEELRECEAFYRKSFEYATAPAQNAGTVGAISYRAFVAGVSNAGVQVMFGTRMFQVPGTFTFYNPSAANALWRNNTTGPGDSGAATADTAGEHGFFARNAQAAGDVVSDEIFIHYSVDAEL